jgi:hypothetical protein
LALAERPSQVGDNRASACCFRAPPDQLKEFGQAGQLADAALQSLRAALWVK